MKTFVIGDIHGAYKAMIQALERAEFNPDEDKLISLGDIADGWSETPKCVEYLLSCKNLIAIRGNHDEWANDWMKSGNETMQWISQGGAATRDAYKQASMYHDFDMNKHKDFFKYQINFYIDEENRGFVHGGFSSKKGLGHEAHEANYYWNRDLWKTAMSTMRHSSCPKIFKSHKEIFIGHTTTMMWGVHEPINSHNIWNLDTGGGFSGKVTVMNIDTKDFFQSDFVKDLYPNEKGR